jgi:nucleotide-binding universal stress UspA family protein
MLTGYKILLATDYSDAAMNAEKYAVQLALNTRSELSLVHIFENQTNTDSTQPLKVAGSKSEQLKLEQTKLEKHYTKLIQDLSIGKADLKADFIVREGNPSMSISRIAKDSRFDFIVMGTHGAGEFKNVFLGSRVWNTIRNSAIPVFAIPKDGAYLPVKKIVFATEQRPGEIPAIKYLVQLAKKLDAEVTVLHISNTAPSKEFTTESFKKFRKELKDKIAYDKLSLNQIFCDDVVEGLNDYCARTEPNLLVLSHEKSSLLEQLLKPGQSVTKEMSFHAHIPLLTIPDYYFSEHDYFWNLHEFNEYISGAMSELSI